MRTEARRLASKRLVVSIHAAERYAQRWRLVDTLTAIDEITMLFREALGRAGTRFDRAPGENAWRVRSFSRRRGEMVFIVVESESETTIATVRGKKFTKREQREMAQQREKERRRAASEGMKHSRKDRLRKMGKPL